MNDEINAKEMVEFESSIPGGAIPVFAWIDGVKIEIGKGRVDPETLLFTTKLNNSKIADTIFDRCSKEDEDSEGKTAVGMIHFTEATLQKRFDKKDFSDE